MEEKSADDIPGVKQARKLEGGDDVDEKGS